MVGRQGSFSVTKRSLRNAETNASKRPRRVVQPKLVDDTVGLSRQEEQELNKALYASLQENRRSRSLLGPDNSSSSTSNGGTAESSKSSISGSNKSSFSGSNKSSISSSNKGSTLRSSSSKIQKSSKRLPGSRQSLRPGTLSNKYHLRQSAILASRSQTSKSSPSISQSHTSSSPASTSNINIDESSQDSSTSSANGSKRKIHAQRKFAQGCSLPGTPTCTPVKSAMPPAKKMSSSIPKTEDFLTFLCLRGTPLLPPHLDIFNYSKEDCLSRAENQRSGPSVAAAAVAEKQQRESTPDTASTSSGANEEVAEAARVATPPVSSRVGMNSLLAKRSAARASASTPETARGIVSLRQGLQRKVSSSPSSSLTCFPVSSPSGLLAMSRLTNNFTSATGHGSKFYFTPEKLISPSKASGIRPGEFTPPPLLSTPSEASCQMQTFSPLVHSGAEPLANPSSSSSSSLLGLPVSPHRKHGGPSGKDLLTVKRSAPGAFTPVAARSSGRVDKPGSTRRGGQEGLVKSARKNLLDRLSSVAQPQARGHRMDSRSRLTAPRPEQKSPKKTDRKLKSVLNKTKKLVRKPQKDMKTKRRMSLRLKEISKSSLENKNTHKHEDRKSGKKPDGSESIIKSKKKSSAYKKERDLKARKPYKIHPLERMRTRGYSLLLASKLALKRAKRETTLVKKKAEIVSGSGNEDKTAKMANQESDLEKVQVKRSQTPSEVNNYRPDDGLKQQSDTKKMAAFRSKDSTIILHNHTKDQNSPKRTPPKKAKQTTSGTPPQPSPDDTIPIFYPTEAEFMDPLNFISKIQPIAESYGMCRIIPPPSWKLDSNKISDDIRFTPQVQQIHRLHKRWGPNVQQTSAINQHLLSEHTSISTAPQIGGVQVDLPQLYQLVEEFGGPKKMSDKKHWSRIADIMNIPKQAMDRTIRLYDIYCHHVFPYATLSADERHQLEEEVKAIYDLQTVDDEAITKGKSMPVSWFSRIARNVNSMWFKDEPTTSQVETEYWRIVDDRTKHVSVQCGHINTRAQASAFPTRKDSAYSRHPWNLNNIPESPSCLLKYLGPVSGITIPTLHMGMLFSTSCWSTDPHCLPYIQYLHTGADIIWYCIPKSQRSKFRSAMLELAPKLLCNKPRWLKEDCVMVNPSLMREHGVKVHRCVHSPHQFVIVFSGAFTATVSCGYNISESVHFVVSSKWLPVGMEAALALTKSGERELFSMSALLCGLTQDEKVDAPTLTEALPLLSSLVYRELDMRTQLHAAGLRSEKRSVFSDSPPSGSSVKKKSSVLENEKVCEMCDRICYLSMVLNEQDEQVLCLEHGLKHIQKKKNLKSTRLFLRYTQVELETMLKNAKDRLTLLTSRAESCPPPSPSVIAKNKTLISKQAI